MSIKIQTIRQNTKKVELFDIINTVFLIILTFSFIYPLYYVLLASFSNPKDVMGGNIFFWPVGFNLEAYKNIYKQDLIWIGYRNNIIYTVFGVLLHLGITVPCAYAVSKRMLPFRNLLVMFFLVPMYFGGGLVATYVNFKNLGLINNPLLMVIVAGFSTWNMVICRTYFDSSIPNDLYEAADLDGCSEFGKFFRIALPLAKPVIAVIALYTAVGRWNDYFTSLMFLSDTKYHSLQAIIQSVIMGAALRLTQVDTTLLSEEELTSLVKQKYMAETMKYGIIFISCLPMLIAYPFVQKYFVKGVMIGSLKG